MTYQANNVTVTVNGNTVLPTERQLYRFKGATFDAIPFFGYWVFSRNGKRIRKWQQVNGRQRRLIAKFAKLPKHEQEKYAL